MSKPRRPRLIDTFCMNDEADMLECRLVELADTVDHFVIVEATTTHQGKPKPLHYQENRKRFEQWADKIVHVVADDLPSVADAPDPWSREHAQREHIATGLVMIGVDADDIVMQSDIDEIPSALHARNVQPSGLIAFEQRLHCFALEWLHPHGWRGTVATRVGSLKNLGDRPFGRMRDSRNTAPCPPAFRDAGWHLSWLGGKGAALRKLDAFCHPEIADRTRAGIEADQYITEGWHVDGVRMIPVEMSDLPFPKWIEQGHEPKSWHRPR